MNEKKKENIVEVIINGKRRFLRPIKPILKSHPQLKAKKENRTTQEESRCPVCKRLFNQRSSVFGNHAGFCRKKCMYGIVSKRKKSSIREEEAGLSKHEKRRNRQIRRQVKINTPLADSKDFYASQQWKELRYIILRKHNFTCLACGRRPPMVVLHCDHIKPRIKYPELQLDPDNLQILCADCNQGKRHYYEDDLR